MMRPSDLGGSYVEINGVPVSAPSLTAWCVVLEGVVLARFRYGSDAQAWMRQNCPPEARVEREEGISEEHRRQEVPA